MVSPHAPAARRERTRVERTPVWIPDRAAAAAPDRAAAAAPDRAAAVAPDRAAAAAPDRAAAVAPDRAAAAAPDRAAEGTPERIPDGTSGDDSGADSGSSSGGDSGWTGGDDSGADSGSSSGGDSGSGDGGCSGNAPSQLTVLNYKNWCSVSINSSTFATGTSLTACVASGTVSLAAMPKSATFELGPAPWHDTAGDTGSGNPGTVSGTTDSTTVVVGAGGKCVWVCCPFASDGSGCPTTDQCP